MPRYEVTIKDAERSGGNLVIDDGRDITRLSHNLTTSGHISTRDVTAVGGRGERNDAIVLFLGAVVRIRQVM